MEYTLSLPVKTFFAIHRAAAAIKRNRESQAYIDLCWIAAIPQCTQAYREECQQMFQDRIENDSIEEGPRTGALSLEDPTAIGHVAGMLDMYRRSIGG